MIWLWYVQYHAWQCQFGWVSMWMKVIRLSWKPLKGQKNGRKYVTKIAKGGNNLRIDQWLLCFSAPILHSGKVWFFAALTSWNSLKQRIVWIWPDHTWIHRRWLCISYIAWHILSPNIANGRERGRKREKNEDFYVFSCSHTLIWLFKVSLFIFRLN